MCRCLTPPPPHFLRAGGKEYGIAGRLHPPDSPPAKCCFLFSNKAELTSVETANFASARRPNARQIRFCFFFFSVFLSTSHSLSLADDLKVDPGQTRRCVPFAVTLRSVRHLEFSKESRSCSWTVSVRGAAAAE